MIKEVQSYRISFTSLFVWLTLACSPVFFLGWTLAMGSWTINDAFLAWYQLVLGINLIAAGLAATCCKWEIIPRGLTGPVAFRKRLYMPFSGITRAERLPVPGLPVLKIENEAGQRIYLPFILNRQEEFNALLNALLPRANPLRKHLKPLDQPDSFAEESPRDSSR